MKLRTPRLFNKNFVSAINKISKLEGDMFIGEKVKCISGAVRLATEKALERKRILFDEHPIVDGKISDYDEFIRKLKEFTSERFEIPVNEQIPRSSFRCALNSRELLSCNEFIDYDEDDEEDEEYDDFDI